MESVLRVDQSHPRGRCPALQATNHPQFCEIPIPIDELSPVPSSCLAAELSAWVGSFAQHEAIVEGHDPRTVAQQACFGRQPERGD
jgi:hypothetical protein